MSKNDSESTSTLDFYSFFGTVIFVITIPLILSILSTILSKTNILDNKNKYVNCKCSICILRKNNYHKNLYKSKFNKYFFIKFLLTLLLIYICYTSFIAIKDENEKFNYKNFEPHEILNVPYTADLKQIKKAYRKLVVSKHPDRVLSSKNMEQNSLSNKDIENIRVEFRRIVKAYEILTDPVKRENFEKYGNPDGPKGLGHIMPNLVINKKYQLPIMILFLLFIVVVLPLFVIYYLKNNNNNEYDDEGNSKTNSSICYYYMNENTLIKHLPFIFGLFVEFNKLNIRSSDEKELNSLWNMCKAYIPNTKDERIPFSNKKAITLIYTWLSRLEENSNIKVSDNLNNDAIKVVNQCIKYFPKVINLICSLNKSKKINRNIKKFGYNCSKSLVEFSQCLHQRLWFDYSPLLQLPYIRQEEALRYNKKFKKEALSILDIANYTNNVDKTNMLKEHLNKISDFSNTEIEDIIKASNNLPYYEINVNYYVQDLDDFVVNDYVTIEINIINKKIADNYKSINKSKEQLIYNCHSSACIDIFEEKLMIFLTEDSKINTNILIDESVCTIKNGSGTVKFIYKVKQVSNLYKYIKT